ncbi:MAG: hypothetical protein WBB01_03630 [Phormidesmis sp.]
MPSEPSNSRLCNQVQSLLQGLGELHRLLALTEGTAPQPLDTVAVEQQVAQLQQRFQQILATVAQVDLAPAVEQRLRPHQTEAHRRSRLLGIETMRLKTAKQAVTLERQRSQLKTHTSALQQFAQAMADELC